MKFNKVFIKLSSVTMVIFIIVLLPLGFIMNKIFTNVYLVQIEQKTTQISKKYTDMIHSFNGMSMMMVKEMSNLTNTTTIVVNLHGEIIVNTSDKNGLSSLKHITNSNKSINKVVTMNNQHYFMSKRVLTDVNGHIIGQLAIFSSLNDIYQSLSKVRWLLIISSIGAIFIALGFTYIMSKRLSSPLVEMEHATRKIAKGNLTTRVKVQSHDEVGSLAEAINDLAFELETYRKTRQEFFANISHELKTPVTYLGGYAKILKEKLFETNEEHDQYLTIIENEASRLNHLINDLFELSKMEEGRLSLIMEQVDIVEIIESVIQKVWLSANEKGLSLKHKFELNVSLINGDGERLEQIFINLVNNAIRYTDKGDIFIGVSQTASDVIIMIKDTGIGIPKSELSLIFERFYRVEKSRSRKYGGNGLGLSITKTLVDLHGGTIHVESKEGVGTTFKVIFPKNERVNDI